MICQLQSFRILKRLVYTPERRLRFRAFCKMTVRDGITPSKRESELFKILTDTLTHDDLSTVLRCAGGWVRDKLLGLESDDIDIAIDNMLGREFAEHINTFLESQNIETRKVAVIMSNPEQSKHLETARMRLADLELDLVNLRSETYTDTRIPEMTFGSPLQDAQRRDFTINSLFYNLNTTQVEDFTGSGLEDLRAGIIRTPLPASQTFLDDPLRVLRALRFAARFAFSLDTDLQEAAATPAVRQALAKKVSRERMGVELGKMFTGHSPGRAMRDMEHLRLLPAVFAVPQSLEAQVGTSYGEAGVLLLEAAEQLLQDWHPQGQPFSKEERRVALMAAFLLPLRAVKVPLKGAKTQPLTSHLLLQSIKWRTSDAIAVEAAHAESSALLQVQQRLQGLAPVDAGDDLKVQFGSSLRALRADKWRIGIFLAPLMALPAAMPIGVDLAETSGSQASVSSSPARSETRMASREARAECCRQLEAAVGALGLEKCWEWKPLMDGKQIMKLLGVKGPAVGKLAAALAKYQLARPDASQQDAQEFLKQKLEEM